MDFKKVLLVVMVVFLGLASFAIADDNRLAQAVEKKLGVTFDLTYKSKYMSYGMQCYGDQGGLFETLNIDLWDSGFSVCVGHESATHSGYENSKRFNYGVAYKNSLFKDASYQTNYKVMWAYRNYYDNARDVKNKHFWTLGASWPKLLDCGIIPRYAIYYETPGGHNYGNRSISGFAHVVGFDYNLNLEALPNPLKLSADMTYNDGLGGDGIDHDFSHITLGMATTFNLSENMSFVPGLYYQVSMDDSINDQNVIYCHLSLKYKF